MKKLFVCALSATLFFASCKSELDPVQILPGEDQKSYPANIEAALDPVVKSFVDGTTIKWNQGDVVKVRTGFSESSPYTDATVWDQFTATNEGASASFDGALRYQAGKNVYAFYSQSGSFQTTQPAMFNQTIPATQTGNPSDVMSNVLLWSKIPASSVSFDGESYSLSATFKPHAAILKFNVASGLDVREIEISCPSICGDFAIRAGSTYGTIGDSSSNFYYPKSLGDKITVRRGGSVISGDVEVVVLASDAYDEVNGTYFNNSESITISFKNGAGKTATVTNTLNKKIQLCSIKDLGSVTSLSFFAEPTGKLVLKDGVSPLTIAVDGAPAGCTCYIEMGEDGAPDPTVSSASFSPSEGYVIPCDDTYTRKMIKVLVTGDGFGQLILKGYLRNWKTISGSGISDAYSSFGNTMTSADNGKISADGIMLNVPRAGKTAYVTFYDNRVKLYDGYFIVRTVNANADCFLRYEAFTTESNRNLSSYKALGADGIASGWIEQWVIDSGATTIETAQSKVLSGAKYNGLAAETPLSVWGNTSWYVKNISLLETGSSIVVPTTKKKAVPVFSFSTSNINPTAVLDTNRIGRSNLAAGCRFYYTTSTVSLDDVATPTSSDTELTKAGISIAAVPTANDVIYVKVLSTGAGFDDTYATLCLQSWHFGWEYEPSGKPASGTDYSFYPVSPNTYKGILLSQQTGLNASWGNRAQFKNNASATTTAKIGGSASIMTVVNHQGEAINGNGLNWTVGGVSLGAATHPAVNANNGETLVVVSPSGNVTQGGTMAVSTGSKWYQLSCHAFMEQSAYTPSLTSIGGVNANTIAPGTSFSF